MRWLLALWRRWMVRRDLYRNEPDRHPALAQFHVGELHAFKGVIWRLADIREQPIAALIFVPIRETKASKLSYLKKLRRADRIMSTIEQQQRQDVPKYVAQAERAGRRG